MPFFLLSTAIHSIIRKHVFFIIYTDGHDQQYATSSSIHSLDVKLGKVTIIQEQPSSTEDIAEESKAPNEMILNEFHTTCGTGDRPNRNQSQSHCEFLYEVNNRPYQGDAVFRNFLFSSLWKFSLDHCTTGNLISHGADQLKITFGLFFLKKIKIIGEMSNVELIRRKKLNRKMKESE